MQKKPLKACLLLWNSKLGPRLHKGDDGWNIYEFEGAYEHLGRLVYI